MNGTVQWVYWYNEFTDNSSFIAWSPIGTGSDIGAAWGWTGNLQDVVPDIMQNISLSLLSGQLSLPDNSTISQQETVCQSTQLQYSYNLTRLLATYGVAIALTLVCIMCGYIAIHNNHKPETLEFSRILASYPQDDRAISRETEIRVDENGRLKCA